MPPAQSADIITGILAALLFRAFSSWMRWRSPASRRSQMRASLQEARDKNARQTACGDGIIMTFLFFGITFIGYHMKIVPQHDRTMYR
jgi:hypothetical protein